MKFEKIDTWTYKVGEHGHVRLVDHMGTDKTIVDAARCSIAGKAIKATSDDLALIRFLMRHRHTTPFEAPCVTIEWKVPIFVARQLVRHRTQSLNEMSARYGEVPEEYYVPLDEDMQMQAGTNKQGRGDGLIENPHQATMAIEQHQREGFALYKELLEMGLARETARIPLSLGTYTQWWATTNLHNLLHLLGLRVDKHAQLETRQTANAVAEIVRALFPATWQAFEDYRLNGMILSHQDVMALRYLIQTKFKNSEDNREGALSVFPTKREGTEFLEKLLRLTAPADE